MLARPLFAAALAALLAVPSAGSAQAKRGTRTQAAAPAGATAPGALTVGGFIGIETGDLSGFALRVDGELPFQRLSPQVNLSLVGSLGYTHFGKDIPFGTIRYNIVHVIPAARFTLPVNPQFDVYGDAGLGLYYYSGTAKTTVPFFGTVEDSTSGVGLMMRFAVGGFYHVSPKLRLGAELGLLPYFNKVDTNDWSLLVGAMFAI
jgi:Outer membrane protein beta-barrel domain